MYVGGKKLDRSERLGAGGKATADESCLDLGPTLDVKVVDSKLKVRFIASYSLQKNHKDL